MSSCCSSNSGECELEIAGQREEIYELEAFLIQPKDKPEFVPKAADDFGICARCKTRPLKDMTTRSVSWCCSICFDSHGANTVTRYRCQSCDYDECEQCYNKKVSTLLYVPKLDTKDGCNISFYGEGGKSTGLKRDTTSSGMMGKLETMTTVQVNADAVQCALEFENYSTSSNGDKATPIISAQLPKAFFSQLKGWFCQIYWCDQGWGNRKGRIGFVNKKGTIVWKNLAAATAMHEGKTCFYCGMFTPEDIALFKEPDDSGVLEVFTVCGGGGGHELIIQECKIHLLTEAFCKSSSAFKKFLDAKEGEEGKEPKAPSRLRGWKNRKASRQEKIESVARHEALLIRSDGDPRRIVVGEKEEKKLLGIFAVDALMADGQQFEEVVTVGIEDADVKVRNVILRSNDEGTTKAKPKASPSFDKNVLGFDIRFKGFDKQTKSVDDEVEIFTIELSEEQANELLACRAAVYWVDQKWGNRKGRIGIKGCSQMKNLFTEEAPHKKKADVACQKIENPLGTQLVKAGRTVTNKDGTKKVLLTLFFVVGGGGGHELRVENFQIQFFNKAYFDSQSPAATTGSIVALSSDEFPCFSIDNPDDDDDDDDDNDEDDW